MNEAWGCREYQSGDEYQILSLSEQALSSGLSPSAFRAQAFVGISETIDLKIQSVLAHESQVQNFTEQ